MANIKVPYLDLKAQYQSIKPEIDAAIAGVLDSCQFVLGSEVVEFEQEFAAYCGTGECIALNSGTSALHLALLAAGVGQGDEVITVPFTFVASVAAVIYSGARPVLVDIDPRSFTMNPSAIDAFDNLIWPHLDTYNWPQLINKDAGPVLQSLTVPAGMECRGRGGV